MATTSSLLGRGLGLVLVEFEYQYQGRDGMLVSIKPNERYVLLAKTNDHWWQVRSDNNSRPFYIPAKYVKELPTDLPLPLDFVDPPSAEPMLVPVTAPVQVPVPVPVPVPFPVPVPKTVEEPSGIRTKPGDEVTIRLRTDTSTGHRKTENRMSTFGIPLDFQDLSHTQRHPSKLPPGPADTGPVTSNRTTNTADGGLSKKQLHLPGVLDNTKDSGKPRVHIFSPSETLTTPRQQNQPIPVETPVVPVVPEVPVVPAVSVVPVLPVFTAVQAVPTVPAVPGIPAVPTVPAVPPFSAVPAVPVVPVVPAVPAFGSNSDLNNQSSLSASCHDIQKSPVELEDEDEVLEEEMSIDESSEDGEEFPKDEDSNHIYESIQDLNLDLEALTGGTVRAGTPQEPTTAPEPARAPASVPPSTQNYSSLCPNVPIYANVSSLKKTVPQISISSPVSPPPPPPDHAPSPPHHTPSSSVSSSGMMSPTSPLSPLDGWQVHTDQDSGKVFYYHPVTKHTTWSDPRSPPAGDMDPSSQGSWEQLVDEVSGRFYYYNPTTRATFWAPPDSPSANTKQDNSPPPLPEEDYPVDGPNGNNNASFTAHVGQIPRARLDLKDGNRKLQEVLNLPQRLMGNGVSEVKNWRHSMAEDVFAVSHRRNISDLTEVTNRRHSPDSPQLADRHKLKRNLSNRSTGSHQLHSHLLEKAGIINKTKVADHGKKIRKNWGQSWTVLHGGILTFHKDPRSAPTGNAMKSSQIVPEYTVELKGASVCWAFKDKSSKKNVLELKTRQGCEYLMQYDTESVICDWLRVIQDAIKKLEHEHLTEDEDEDASEKEGKDRKRIPTPNSSSTAESEQRQVRTKLRRFLQRRPTLQNVKDKGYIRDNVFGCHLDTLCHRENTIVPRFVEKCIRSVERRGLDIDGIYRVSGNLAVIQKLRYKVDREEPLDLEDGQWEEIHVITGALKLFLRELPEPLFPFSCFDKFIAAIQVQDYNLRVSYMKDLVRSLPLPNHDTMELLFKHLRRVIEHKDHNRMSVQSIAIVFGPTLLRPETESSDMTIHMVFQSQIVELMLKEFQTVFSQT
ncbi:rho GTPase-activating protein 27-like isoform X2 [Channa argus]|uniref:rho GTPase-activating protein 27-like isoform X2 n=1 Tax=Channa argus TaxID=215402 RepID=UPI002945C23C|nr:hypothetical protein Q8A73_016814 [Channa argus]